MWSTGQKNVPKNGLGIIALRNAGHLGRIGGWAELLADKGLISIHFVTVAGSRIVAPFGGKQARISTAPVAIGVPHEAEVMRHSILFLILPPAELLREKYWSARKRINFTSRRYG